MLSCLSCVKVYFLVYLPYCISPGFQFYFSLFASFCSDHISHQTLSIPIKLRRVAFLVSEPISLFIYPIVIFSVECGGAMRKECITFAVINTILNAARFMHTHYLSTQRPQYFQEFHYSKITEWHLLLKLFKPHIEYIQPFALRVTRLQNTKQAGLLALLSILL